jgi:hypothetical protein
MLFVSKADIKRTARVTLSFDIGDIETVNGLVLRNERLQENDKLYKNAVQFTYSDDTQKDRLFKFILKVQRDKCAR